MPRKRPPPSPDSDPPSGVPFSEARTTETEVILAPQSTGPTRPVLTLLSGVNAGQVFGIDRNEVVIGRAREARVRLDDVGISRRHARLVRTGPLTFRVEDTGSTNGVYVNGEKVQAAALAPGDHVQVGSDVVLRFSVVDPAEEALAHQLFESSTRDALTGAFNRKYFMSRLTSEVAYAERHKTKLGLLLFDLDHFKKVNDRNGHAAGDAVLRQVGVVVSRLLRAEDVFARYGGEEFTVVVRGITGDNVFRLAQRIRKTVAETRVPWEESDLRVTLSIGMALLDDTMTGGALGLVELADGRMYRAKEAGRNCVIAE